MYVLQCLLGPCNAVFGYRSFFGFVNLTHFTQRTLHFHTHPFQQHGPSILPSLLFTQKTARPFPIRYHMLLILKSIFKQKIRQPFFYFELMTSYLFYVTSANKTKVILVHYYLFNRNVRFHHQELKCIFSRSVFIQKGLSYMERDLALVDERIRSFSYKSFKSFSGFKKFP